MASSSTIFSFPLIACTLFLLSNTAFAQLSPNFYSKTCPQVMDAVRSVVRSAVAKEKRMGASLLRLQFHDCFVNECDGSVLLDDTPTFIGEKTAFANINSLRGFHVIDNVKLHVEEVCPGVVSCADIVVLSALEGVIALGGPKWQVNLGRRDSKSASLAAANSGVIPPPTSTLNNLINRFRAVGLSSKDLVVLSGAHTIGKARCTSFRTRIYNDTNINPTFAKLRQANCPSQSGSGDNNLAPIDVRTPDHFDNNYYKNLIDEKVLFPSDQQLFTGGFTDSWVTHYSKHPGKFKTDFAAAMIKMGDIRPLTDSDGEIRQNCRKVNS